MKPALLSAAFVLISFFIIHTSFAQAGTLDQSFGNGGEVVTNIGSFGEANATVIQPDGKIIAIGDNLNGFALARYQTNGNLDSSFGNNGIAITAFTNNNNGTGEGKSVALQSDGKIIVGGIIDSFLVNGEFYRYAHFTLVRYSSTGKVDSSFGENGKVISVLVSEKTNDQAFSIVIQPDGKIIAAGSHWTNSYKIQDFAMVRYQINGAMDSSFGVNGIVITSFTQPADGHTVLLDNNKIILTGSIGSAFGLTRYNINGAIDSSFGLNGTVVSHFGNYQTALINSALIQPDGKIVVGGYIGYSSDTALLLSFGLARYENNGQNDTSFGVNGIVTTDFVQWQQARIAGITLQPDGKIVAAGVILNGPFTLSNFALGRYLSNGNLDSSFGMDGKVITNFIGGSGATSIALQTDEKIVVAGYQGNYLNPTGFALARYNNDQSLPVNILSFTATKQNTSVLLNWQTTNELNNNYFAVEKSNDGNNFSYIGNVSSKGNSAQKQSYDFIDTKPFNGKNFYRLKQVDKNGKFTYSSIVNADFSFVSSVKIYPNPAKDILNITGLNSTSASTISVIDINGKILLQKNIASPNYQLNIQQLTPGNYYLRIESNKQISLLKFVKE